MKTSFENIMARDFEQFLTEDLGKLGDLDFKALGVIPDGRKNIWGAFWRKTVKTAAGFSFFDYLVFASPAAVLAAIIFIGKPLMGRILQAYLQGM